MSAERLETRANSHYYAAMRRLINSTILHHILLICLIGNLMLPSIVAANEVLSGVPTRVLLCTSQGYQWVKLESAQLPSADPSSQHCIYCLLSEDDSLDVLLNRSTIEFENVQGMAVVSAHLDALAFLLPATPSARSPPMSI